MEIEAKTQPKRKLWKVIVGWMLFTWGIIGLVTILVVPFIPLQPYDSLLQVIINGGISLLFIYSGWKLVHNKG